MINNDDIILHYHDVVIRKLDLETLNPGQWLNDTMIEFHMEFLERTFLPKDAKYLFLRPGIVHLITFAPGDVSQLESALPPYIDQYDVIFIPVNDGRPDIAYSGSHWSLMVYVRAINAFYYYDTLRYNNLRNAELTRNRIYPLLKVSRAPQVIPSTSPQQDNTSDCGVYVISMMDYILHQLLKARVGKHIQYAKIMMLKSKQLSTPKEVRNNMNSMIKRLQQRTIVEPLSV
ncbi:hypothetical protein BDB01DRAFT_778072 [Pilobolus umbonatus]|nr:hypothetical protein BDB01DRAFT_778072 [Pilobolus umbonatus]